MPNTNETAALVAAAAVADTATETAPAFLVETAAAIPAATAPVVSKPKAAKPVKAPKAAKATIPAVPVVSKPSTTKPAKRATKPTKPAAASAPVAKPAASADASRLENLSAMRAASRALYAGASPVFHAKRATKPADLIERVATPKQRISVAPSTRDASFAAALVGIDADTDILALLATGADLGAVSRLASVGAIITNGERITLKPEAVKRVAAGNMPN